MTYVLNSTASVAPAKSINTSKSMNTAGLTFWQRLYVAMIESRRRSAIRELRARSYLVNEAEIVLGGFPQTAQSQDAALPFNR
ncbi:hypothetical protein [Bosea sp. (in: a-proteobacteria)]|uniref:hypothetical protein n=1 Tax=Bosea sp. (in: a-proteobacteria) TaxID=1871050 RepID=UPI003F7115BC